MTFEQDKLLAEVLGFNPDTGDRFGNNRRISPSKEFVVKTEKYSSWDDLVAVGSPWRGYLENPAILAKEQIPLGKGYSHRLRRSIKKRVERRAFIKRKIRMASELTTRINNARKNINPHLNVLIVDDSEKGINVRMGDIIAALCPSVENVVRIASTPPLGSDGSLQMLSNIANKAVIVNRGLSYTGYFPHKI